MTHRPTRRQALAFFSALPLLACAGPEPSRRPTLGPPEAATRLARIAFGTCADQNRPQPIWDAIIGYRPDLFVFAGDNVYGDVSSAALDELKAAYAKAMTVEGFARARATLPHVAIWDDHDYGLNDAGAEFPHKKETKRLFLDFWNAPKNDPRRGREGLYHAWSFGPPGARVQVVLLDTRTFRSALKRTDRRNAPGHERYVPDFDPAKTMLGEAQWAWLGERLREPADLRLVFSGIQLVVEGHGYERWGNLPLERARFYRLIRETGANGVVVLSGDRHFGALYRENEAAPYPLVEMTSSGISRHYPGVAEAGPNRLGDPYGEANFGAIDIDWEAREVVLALRDIRGAAVRQLRVDFDALRGRHYA